MVNLIDVYTSVKPFPSSTYCLKGNRNSLGRKISLEMLLKIFAG